MITTETLKYIIIAKLVNSEPAIAVNNYTYIAMATFLNHGSQLSTDKSQVFMILLNYQLHSECMTVVFICIYQLC